MPKKYILGNWKMHQNKKSILDFFNQYNPLETDAYIGIAPQALHLETCLENSKNIHIGSQNCSSELKGAHTGEISIEALLDLGVQFTLIGHSERRSLYAEDDFKINKKLLLALSQNLLPILCIGESLEDNEAGNTFETINHQLRNALVNIPNITAEQLVIAYEPVWAIGTGKTATPEFAESVHQQIREILNNIIGEESSKVSILYGGSVKPENINDLLQKPNINGALVGGASLSAESFNKLCEATR